MITLEYLSISGTVERSIHHWTTLQACGWKSVIKFSFLQAGSVYELLSVSWQLPHSYLEAGEFWKWAETSVLEGSRRMESLCQNVQDELNAPIVQVSSITETHYCLLPGGDVFLRDTLSPYCSLTVPVDSVEYNHS